MKAFFLHVFSAFATCAMAQQVELVIPKGHAISPADIARSPDKRLLATGSDDGSMILWDARTGLQLKQFPLVKKGQVGSVAFSPNGQYAAAATENLVALVDAPGTRLIDTFRIAGTNTGVVFTKDNQYLISCGLRGKVTVWRLSDRRQVAVFNPMQGLYDYDPYLVDLCLSPDGKQLAVGGGQYSYGITLFQIPTSDDGWATIRDTRKALKMPVRQIGYVSDGKYLVIKAHADELVLVNPADATIVSKVAADVNRFAVIPDANYFLTTSYSNGVEKWSLPDLKRIGPVAAPKVESVFGQADGSIYATHANSNVFVEYRDAAMKTIKTQFKAATNVNMFLAVSPDGKLLALNNEGSVKIFNVAESRLVKQLKTSAVYGPYEIQFDKTGRYLYVNEAQLLSQWQVSDWTKKKTFEHNGVAVITDFAVSTNGQYLATVDDGSGKPMVKLWNTATGVALGSRTFANGLSACRFSPDSKALAVIGGLESLSTFTVPALAPLFKGGETAVGENLTYTPDGRQLYTFDRNAIYTTPVAGGTTRLLHSEGTPSKFASPVTTLDLAPDGQSFVMKGEDNVVMHCDMTTAKPFAYLREQNGIVTSISFAGNGKYYATAGYDGQVILRNTQDSILCSVFTFANSPDWVVVTPRGRFDATIPAQERMYYHKKTEVLPLAVLFEQFYTPRLLPRLLAGEVFAPVDNIDNLKKKPVVKMAYAAVQRNLEVGDDKPTYQNSTGVAEITITATAEEDTIDEIRLFHNGKILNLATRNLIVADNSGSDIKRYTVNLLPGNNSLRAVALNSQRTESQPDEIDVVYKPAGAPVGPPPNNKTTGAVAAIDKNATLHLVVVGINQYSNPKMSLNYALADATAFKAEAEKDAKTVMGSVRTYLVTDGAANKAGILNALKQVQVAAKPQDVFIFYYAGHGVIAAKDKAFFLVPTDVSDLKNIDDELKTKGLAAATLQQFATDIKAQKQLFILDACQSAGAFESLLAADGEQQKSIAVAARTTGSHWMAASGSQQFANEFSALGHGAFTYVLLQALKGSALSNGMITVNGLKSYLQAGVPELMKKYNGAAQYPASYGFGADFPVEIKK